jgi:hypothetical protein
MPYRTWASVAQNEKVIYPANRTYRGDGIISPPMNAQGK